MFAVRLAALAVVLGMLAAGCGGEAVQVTTVPTTLPPASTTVLTAATTSVPSTTLPEPATTSTLPPATTTTTTLLPWPEPGFPEALPPEAIPWDEVGTGWLLVRYFWRPEGSPDDGYSQVLLLIGPDDTTYAARPWPDGVGILDWSPDGRRVLSFADGSLRVTDLRDGTTTVVPDLYGLFGSWDYWTSTARFTRPSGRDIMVGLGTWDEPVRLECLHPDGTRFAQLVDLEVPPYDAYDPDRIDLGVTWLYGQTGTEVVVATREGISLLTNQGALLRRLATPGLGCTLSRWWDETSVLAACNDPDWAVSPCWAWGDRGPGGGRSLWSVPIDGSPATRLTPRPACDPKTGSPEHVLPYWDALSTGGVIAAETEGCCESGELNLISGDTVTGWTGGSGTGATDLVAIRGDRFVVWDWVAVSTGEERGAILEVATDGTVLRAIFPTESDTGGGVWWVLTTAETLFVAGRGYR